MTSKLNSIITILAPFKYGIYPNWVKKRMSAKFMEQVFCAINWVENLSKKEDSTSDRRFIVSSKMKQ